MKDQDAQFLRRKLKASYGSPIPVAPKARSLLLVFRGQNIIFYSHQESLVSFLVPVANINLILIAGSFSCNGCRIKRSNHWQVRKRYMLYYTITEIIQNCFFQPSYLKSYFLPLINIIRYMEDVIKEFPEYNSQKWN